MSKYVFGGPVSAGRIGEQIVIGNSGIARGPIVVAERIIRNRGATLSPMTIGDGSSVVINGRTYKGRTVEVRDDRVYIDGKEVVENDEREEGPAAQEPRTISITIQGTVEGDVSLDVGKITIAEGSVRGNIKTASADVVLKKGNVGGSASSMSGNVNITGDVGGDASSMSGNVKIGGDTRGSRRR